MRSGSGCLARTAPILVSATSSDFPLGPGRTVALSPDGEGTHATAGSFVSNSGALGPNGQLRLDEAPAWTIVDWVSQSEGFAPERPARLHLFDLGARGVMLVGLERPDSFDPPP